MDSFNILFKFQMSENLFIWKEVFRMWDVIPIWYSVHNMLSYFFRGDYGHGTMFSMYRKNGLIIFLWFGGTSSNYIYQQPAIFLRLQKYREKGYIISFVALEILSS